MTINYVDGKLVIEAPELVDFDTNMANYTGITITTNIGCTTDNDSTIDTSSIIDTTKNVYIENNILYIKSQYFDSQSAFMDGIYNISLKFNTTTGYVKIHTCYFVDVTIKCKVGSLLQNIIKENESNTEPVSTIAHTLHYSLVNGSNCGCNCTEMCDVFNALLDLLENVDTKLVNDCGC